MRTLFYSAAALAAFGLMASPAAAHATPCAMLTDAGASRALGMTVVGQTVEGMPSGMDSCDFLDPVGATAVSIMSERGVFPAGAGAADLAQRYIPSLPSAALSQIQALQQAGMNFDLPDYQVTQVDGVGDAAVLVRTELLPGLFAKSLIVLHGSDAYSFLADDGPEAQAKLTAVALAALG